MLKDKTKTTEVKYIREDDPDLNNAQEIIDYLADAYRLTGEMEYRDVLLECFEGYFLKYVNILAGHNGVSINNKDTRNFLRLFMSKEDRANPFTYSNAAGGTIHKIRRSVKSYSTDDVYNEIIIIFLELLEAYKPISFTRKDKTERISFAHYIQVNIRYKLCHWIAKRSKDVITGRDWVQYNDFVLEDEEALAINFEDNSVGIDLNGWVWGKTARGVFSELKESERYLLWMMYEADPEGKTTMVDIADKMGVHYQTIVYRMDRIRDKLRAAQKKKKHQ